MPVATPKRIWIDLDNTPHVPFFIPIVEELDKRGYAVVLTARNSYQVRDLVQFHRLSCKFVGRHWGKRSLLKILGTCKRALNLAGMMIQERPDLAVSHGSRSQLLASRMLRVPSVMIYDYEFASRAGLRPNWVFVPKCLADPAEFGNHVLKYPGLKEDVYVPRFHPDASMRARLGFKSNEIVATMRPPATDAHYHNPQSELLFNAAVERLVQYPNVCVVLLPRSERQTKVLQEQWRVWMGKGKIVIPGEVMDGLNVIWNSDLVISGGGTMNREAAALGIPVYSVFRGRIGAVDRYLSESNRLVLLESVDDVRTKIVVERRKQAHDRQETGPRVTLSCIVDGIASIAEYGRLPQAS